ncbi:10153_t:CDS:2 [Dentiscutata erythropus]|uniref:10153_t:CDS:1 n=1 Tax=Dentiscutata erythropus TaxID=1348616 RepID=A0A9N9J2Q4_9GLOM|nr:10153_t:CDS:2 [Dentiscutata erythropus]
MSSNKSSNDVSQLDVEAKNQENSETLIAIPVSRFLPLFSEITQIFDNIAELYQNAQNNKFLCGTIFDKTSAVDVTIHLLKFQRDSHKRFFNQKNYVVMQNFLLNIQKLKKFVNDVMKSLNMQANLIDKTFRSLIDEFDNYVSELGLLNIPNQIPKNEDPFKFEIIQKKNVQKFDNDGNKTNLDEDNTITAQITIPFPKFVSVMHEIMNVIEDIITIHQSAEHNKLISSALVDKTVSIETTFPNLQKIQKYISEVTQLKGLEKYIHAKSIQTTFYELTTEFDNYVNKLKFAITVDPKVRAEREKAMIRDDIEELYQKPTNCVEKYLRLIDDEAVAFKLVADELDTADVKNDIRSHVAILMKLRDCHQIIRFYAEQKIPYKNLDDIMEIKNRVYKEKYREPFTNYSNLPKEYREITMKAIGADPDFRPTITEMFKTLEKLQVKLLALKLSTPIMNIPSDASSVTKDKEISRMPLTPDDDDNIKISEVISFAEFNYMSMREATLVHRVSNGNLEMAFKCFKAYAQAGNLKAKYFLAYYLYKKLINTPYSDKEREKRAAELFKEVADSGDEVPDAQLKYGLCLFLGTGVDRNFSEATKYFQKAADNGLAVGMYNAGNIFYTGLTGVKEELGIKYIREAAQHNHLEAMEFCKKNNISIF